MRVKLKDISKIYEKNKKYNVVLCNINYEFTRGEFYLIKGKSGCGKTTLLNLIATTLKFSTGDILFDNLSLTHSFPYARAKLKNKTLGIVFQNPLMSKTLTVRENIMLPTYINHMFKQREHREALEDLAEIFNMSEKLDNYPDELSASEQQLMCVMRSLINDPKVIVADEPLDHLSSASRKVYLDYLHILNNRGVIVIMTSKINIPQKYITKTLKIENKTLVEVKNEK